MKPLASPSVHIRVLINIINLKKETPPFFPIHILTLLPTTKISLKETHKHKRKKNREKNQRNRNSPLRTRVCSSLSANPTHHLLLSFHFSPLQTSTNPSPLSKFKFQIPTKEQSAQMTRRLDEYELFVNRMNTPRVVIDNAFSPSATLIKVDSARKHGILLEAVQALTDLDLCIKKGYISSDGKWFMDVFHCTDLQGRKIPSEDTSHLVSHLERSLTLDPTSSFPHHRVLDNLTSLELTGSDRPGLLSEVFAVLSDLNCSVVEAKVWTHNGRIGAIISVKDSKSGSVIDDKQTSSRIRSKLKNVLKGDNGYGSDPLTEVSYPARVDSDLDRRLHQIMFADRDYERREDTWRKEEASTSDPSVSVQNWAERGYSVVAVQCKDRAKLLFDVVCTLTDMEYVVSHGTVDTTADLAHQEFYIRHLDGSPISSEAERQRVIQCLQAAIKRRSSEGVKLKLCTEDRPGLLAFVTRTFRENGLSVTRADVSTRDQTAMNEFHVTDAWGRMPDPKLIESVIQRIGVEHLKVNEELKQRYCVGPAVSERGARGPGPGGFLSLGSIVRRNLFNLGLVKSCS